MSGTAQEVRELAEEPAPPAEGAAPRLAAMVFTDVVGYSARMGADEQGTIAAVHADFERMRELCAKHGGEVINTMGDGMMLAFGGAVSAMRFGLDMQNEFAARSQREGKKALQHRMGIHIGDVWLAPGGHLAGDGVNIAARLEPRAPHGGIAISQIVYDSVKAKIPKMRAERMGPQTFKNIAEPIVVWRIAPDVEAKPYARHVQTPTVRRFPIVKTIIWLAIILGAIDLLWPYREVPLSWLSADVGMTVRGWINKVMMFLGSRR